MMSRLSRVARGVLVAAVMLPLGCGGSDESGSASGGDGDTPLSLTQSQRIDIFHEVENAILEKERQGREEHPEGGPQCLEYIACLDDESKMEIAEAHGLTVPQLEEVIREGEQSGWSQW